MKTRHVLTGLALLVAFLAAPAVARAGHDDSFRFRLGFGIHAPRPVEVYGGAEMRHGRPPMRHHRCDYVPGHYETRTVEVWVPGCWREEWVPPVYREIYTRGGTCTRILVRPATLNRIWIPGRCELQTTSIWVPGFWACGCR